MSRGQGVLRTIIAPLIDFAAAYLIVAVVFALFGLSQGTSPELAVRLAVVILPTALLMGVGMPILGFQDNWLAVLWLLPLVAAGLICWLSFRFVRNRPLRIVTLAGALTAYAFAMIYITAQTI